MSIENEQSSPDNKENNNNNKDSKNVNSVFVPKKTILGFSVPLFF
ncbi:hypothetical protein [New Jersey aster yellows phytoplasma]|nr:hypothetical protein [New Jersey aster yellows phytoplasma]